MAHTCSATLVAHARQRAAVRPSLSRSSMHDTTQCTLYLSFHSNLAARVAQERGTALHCLRSQDIRTRAPLHFRLTNLHACSLYESVGAALSCCAHSFSCAHPCASPLYPSLSFFFGTHLWACSRSSACCTLGSHKLADHTTTATVQRHHKTRVYARTVLSLDPASLLSSPILLSLSFCLHSLAGFALLLPVCVCQPPPEDQTRSLSFVALFTSSLALPFSTGWFSSTVGRAAAAAAFQHVARTHCCCCCCVCPDRRSQISVQASLRPAGTATGPGYGVVAAA
jgi:hypothetical protein